LVDGLSGEDDLSNDEIIIDGGGSGNVAVAGDIGSGAGVQMVVAAAVDALFIARHTDSPDHMRH